MADDASTSSHRRQAGGGFGLRVLAALSVLVSAAISFVFARSAVDLVREKLHHSCEMPPPGSEGAGTWICSGDMSYFRIAGILIMGWLAVVLVGLLIALLVRRDRQARLGLVILACLSIAWILGLTWYESSTQVEDQYAPLTGAEYWVRAVGPAAVVGVIGLAVGMWSLRPTRPLSWILGIGATVLLILATVLQPGLSLNFIPAAGLLAAAVVRGVGAGAMSGRVTREAAHRDR